MGKKQKMKIELVANEGATPKTVECDGYLAITWDTPDDGSRAVSVHVPRKGKGLEEVVGDLLVGVDALSYNLSILPLDSAQLVGGVLQKTLQSLREYIVAEPPLEVFLDAA